MWCCWAEHPNEPALTFSSRRPPQASASCVVLDGEPGVGKTELLAYAASAATGFCVLRTAGVESELELGFAGLLELVRPVLHLLEMVPPAQGAALKAALGLAPPATASRLLVAAGLLSLVASAAQRDPVLVLVDDLQWVDAPSAQALLFAARRLRADRVAVIIAHRSDEQLPVQTTGLARATVTGLDRETASQLLSGRAPGVADLVVDELHSSTGGNPLAMLEIVSRLSSSQRAGKQALPATLPRVGGIEDAFYRRASNLSEDTLHALVLVSASGDADLALLGPALAQRGYTVSDLGPAVDAGLLQLEGGRAAWRHPLVRSAVYHRSPMSERRSAHRAIAASLSEGSAAWAWHQAAAAEGPDSTGRQRAGTGGRRSLATGRVRRRRQRLRAGGPVVRGTTGGGQAPVYGWRRGMAGWRLAASRAITRGGVGRRGQRRTAGTDPDATGSHRVRRGRFAAVRGPLDVGGRTPRRRGPKTSR